MTRCQTLHWIIEILNIFISAFYGVLFFYKDKSNKPVTYTAQTLNNIPASLHICYNLSLCPIYFHIYQTLITKYYYITVLCSNRVSQMTKTYNDIEAVTRLLEEVSLYKKYELEIKFTPRISVC